MLKERSGKTISHIIIVYSSFFEYFQVSFLALLNNFWTNGLKTNPYALLMIAKEEEALEIWAMWNRFLT